MVNVYGVQDFYCGVDLNFFYIHEMKNVYVFCLYLRNGDIFDCFYHEKRIYSVKNDDENLSEKNDDGQNN